MGVAIFGPKRRRCGQLRCKGYAEIFSQHRGLNLPEEVPQHHRKEKNVLFPNVPPKFKYVAPKFKYLAPKIKYVAPNR